MSAPRRNVRMLHGSEKVGFGELFGPEDLAYDHKSGVIYTGTADGWIKRVTVRNDSGGSVVENWFYLGGRPLGLSIGHYNNLILTNGVEGLLNLTQDRKLEVLTNEADGVKFKLTDAVDIANDGVIYFTDASSKYTLNEVFFDFLEGRPHGRLLSFDPSTKETKVLIPDLYFANGVAVSPDQDFVIFCESAMRRCRKYWIQGERKGSVDNFIDNLPGIPDNIRYDGEGQYWIALFSGVTFAWDLAFKYPSIRKVLAMISKYIGRPHMEKNGGVLAVDLQGKPTAHYYDPGMSFVSSGIKIENHLYCGSLLYPYITRLDLNQHGANATV